MPRTEAYRDAFCEQVAASWSAPATSGAGVTELGKELGLSAAALEKTVDALVEAGRLLAKKSARSWSPLQQTRPRSGRGERRAS